MFTHPWRNSVASLAAMTGLNAQRLRGVLIQAGLVEPDDPRMHGSVAFDAAVGEAVAQTLVDALTLKEVDSMLGVPWLCAEGLVEAGVLEPVAAPGCGGGVRRYAVRRADVEALQARLLEGAEPVERRSADDMTLRAASQRTGQSVVMLIAAVAKGALRPRRRLCDREGVPALLLARADIDHVFPAPMAADHLRSADAAKHLGVTHGTLAALAADGFSPTGVPLGQRHLSRPGKERWVPMATIEAFDQIFVSIGKRARELNVSAFSLASKILGLGIEPAFDVRRFKARIYRRVDLDRAVNAVLPKLKPSLPQGRQCPVQRPPSKAAP